MTDSEFQRRVARNPALLCAQHALMMSLFPMAIVTLFLQDHLGLTMAEIMWVQAAFGIGLAVFEFPSGYLADRIGYRRSMILASLLSVFAWTLYSMAIGFWSVVAAQIMMGFALSLVSGTNSAMLFESLANLDRENEFTKWFGRARFFGQFAEGSAALVAGILFAISVRLPFQLMILVWILNLGIALLMVEPRFERHAVEKPLEHVRKLLHFVRFRAPRLRALFAVSVALGLASFVPVWIVTLYARDAGVPLSWLGPMWAAANYCVALGSLASDRLGRSLSLVTVCVLCTALITLGYLGMGFTYAWWGFAFYFAFNLSRGLSGPLLAHAEQEEIPSGDRASVVSMRSLLFRAAFVVVGPIVGMLIDVQGRHSVLLGLGVFLAIAALLACRELAQHPAQEPDPTPTRASI
ncbi:MAG: MFS transporter [Myxococcota bacterium]